MENNDLKQIMENFDKRTLNIYFLLDTSGSSSGEIINVINREMNIINSRISDNIKELKLGNVDTRFRILEYGGFSDNKTSWLTGDRINFDNNINISNLIPEGNTWLSEAIIETSNSLSECDKGTKPYPSIVIIVGDALYSGPEENLIRAIEKLNQVRNDTPIIISVCSFSNQVDGVFNRFVSKDKFNNPLIIDSLSDDNLKKVIGQAKLSVLRPTKVFKGLDII